MRRGGEPRAEGPPKPGGREVGQRGLRGWRVESGEWRAEWRVESDPHLHLFEEIPRI